MGEKGLACVPGGGREGWSGSPPFPLPLSFSFSLYFPSGLILAGLAREKEEGVKESES